MNKYKLIKEYPSSPKLGSIFIWYNESYDYRELSHSFSGHILEKKEVENFPEFYSKHMFTTEDNIDIYIGDKFYYLTKDDKIFGLICDSYSGGFVVAHSKLGDKYFSTKEKAEEYLKSLNSLLKIGYWYKQDEQNIYVLITNNRNVGFIYDDWNDNITIIDIIKYKLADLNIIKELLLNEAKKRYNNAITVKSVINPNIIYPYKYLLPRKCKYIYQKGNIIMQTIDSNSGGITIYSNGKWAEIDKMKEYFGVCEKGSWETFNTTQYSIIETRNKSWKWFNSEKERDEFIKFNRPLYSLNDILSFNTLFSNITIETENSEKLGEFIIQNNLIKPINNIINDLKKITENKIQYFKINKHFDLDLMRSIESISIVVKLLDHDKSNIRKVLSDFFKINKDICDPQINKFISISIG